MTLDVISTLDRACACVLDGTCHVLTRYLQCIYIVADEDTENTSYSGSHKVLFNEVFTMYVQ